MIETQLKRVKKVTTAKTGELDKLGAQQIGVPSEGRFAEPSVIGVARAVRNGLTTYLTR